MKFSTEKLIAISYIMLFVLLVFSIVYPEFPKYKMYVLPFHILFFVLGPLLDMVLRRKKRKFTNIN